MSADGKDYVSVIFRVKPDGFPIETPTDFNYEIFTAQLLQYLDEIPTNLSGATGTTFTPSIQVIEDLIQSIT
jgi:hypothetical protein